MSERHSKEIPERPSPLELEAFLPYACAQLLLPFSVHVELQTQDEYVRPGDEKSKKSKPGKSTLQRLSLESQQQRDEIESDAAPPDDDAGDVVEVVVVRDAGARAVELALERAPLVPRALFKLLALCAPYHAALARLSLRRARLRGAALYEAVRLLPHSHITELCLDDSPVPERNYHLLLDEPARLRSLSLARCALDDADCAPLAARLPHPRPASRSLLLLSLVGNRLSDVGAAALAVALRSNRTLQYLDLCGNRITDDGAGSLLAVLREFPLTAEEVVEGRRRVFEHLRRRAELARHCREELAASERVHDEPVRAARRRQTLGGARARRLSLERRATALGHAAGTSAGDHLWARAQAMAAELAGPLAEPFGADETRAVGGRTLASGNTALCALNLAYNELGYASVERLLGVLRWQEARRAGGAGAGGLVRVVLEGNPLPACGALEAAQALLERAGEARGGRAPRTRADHRAAGRAKSK